MFAVQRDGLALPTATSLSGDQAFTDATAPLPTFVAALTALPSQSTETALSGDPALTDETPSPLPVQLPPQLPPQLLLFRHKIQSRSIHGLDASGQLETWTISCSAYAVNLQSRLTLMLPGMWHVANAKVARPNG